MLIKEIIKYTRKKKRKEFIGSTKYLDRKIAWNHPNYSAQAFPLLGLSTKHCLTNVRLWINL